jgi:hypothetical protein
VNRFQLPLLRSIASLASAILLARSLGLSGLGTSGARRFSRSLACPDLECPFKPADLLFLSGFGRVPRF